MLAAAGRRRTMPMALGRQVRAVTIDREAAEAAGDFGDADRGA